MSWTVPSGANAWQTTATYTVTATSSGNATGSCNAPASAGSCAVSGLTAGAAYSASVVATFQGWTSSAATTTFNTAVAGANKLVFTTVPSGNQTATATATIGSYVVTQQTSGGSPFVAASPVVVQLSSNSAGTKFFSATSGGTTPITTITIATGQSASPSFYYADNKAGSPTLTAHNASIPNDGTTSPTIVAATASQLVLSAASTTPTAGTTDNLTITAKDTFGNVATGYNGDMTTIQFTGASTIGSFTPTVTNKTGTAVAFGTNETITFTNGVATVSSGSNGAMVLYKVETKSIVVSDGTISNGTGLSITVSAAAASTMQLSQCLTNDSPVTCSNAISGLGNGPSTFKADIDIFDAYGNVPSATAASITFTNSNTARFTITPSGGVSVTGTGSPTNRSGQFTVTFSGTSSATTTIHAQATNFTDLVFTVSK